MTKQQSMYLHVDRWSKSGLSVRGYSKKHNISHHSLRYWIDKKTGRTKKTDIYESCEPVSFVELSSFKDKPVEISSASAQKSINSNPMVELSFPGGICLKIYV